MKLVVTLFLVVFATMLNAETPRNVVGTFDDAVSGATSIASLPNGVVIVSRPAGSLMCVLDVPEPYFPMFIEGKEAVTRIPRAVCTSLRNVELVEDKQ